MSISQVRMGEYPPNIADIRAAFPSIVGRDSIIFAYAPDVYVPSGEPMSPQLAAHEATHIRQQGDNPAHWWSRYLSDREFRYEQELEAHRVEYQVVCHRIKDRNARALYLNDMSSRLASGMYGSVVSRREAIAAIRGTG